MTGRPNVLFVMCDQLRFDAIAALGNSHIYTPNMDRLVRRGVSFTNAYTTCPVCIPARYTIRTGRESLATAIFQNERPNPAPGQAATMRERCGPYLAEAMADLGYRTFGIGKFHTIPWDEPLGYEYQTHSEELYGSPDQRARDGFASFIAKEYPEFDFLEGLMGERTEMYYMPQMSAMPASVTVEAWAAGEAVRQIERADDRPFFGLVSFIGPHPPCAPPIPFNRMYDPDRMPDPVCGNREVDHMDEQITWMNYAIWADDISPSHTRVIKARYYGEVSYIDHCLGRILDAVEARADADNTLICFYSDHGDHLGDHHAWQKESFFEPSCHVPFLLSWPARISSNVLDDGLVCLTDLFGIATAAAERAEVRDGIDVLAMIEGEGPRREYLAGYYGRPGTPLFKIMVRDSEWKYIFMANGGREQLFNLCEDPYEQHEGLNDSPDVTTRLRKAAIQSLPSLWQSEACDGGELKVFPFKPRELRRIYQFDRSKGVSGFPDKPEDVLEQMSPDC